VSAAAPDRAPTASERARGYAVHAYTASGVAFAFAAAIELCSADPSPVRFFLYNVAAVFVDATDGPLARAWQVKKWAPTIDGRTIDDIVDYLTFTFLPLLLIWRMGWIPEPRLLWVVPALMASLFGFANTGAKDEGAGFFLGFPSYWNVVAVYAGIAHHFLGPWINAALLVALAVLTVLPVRFIYPNLAPRPWKVPLLGGAVVWLAILVWMLADYPSPPGWLVWLSLVYPALYTALSIHLSRRR
jgi:phosphatidylcholine synthase